MGNEVPVGGFLPQSGCGAVVEQAACLRPTAPPHFSHHCQSSVSGSSTLGLLVAWSVPEGELVAAWRCPMCVSLVQEASSALAVAPAVCWTVPRPISAPS